MLSQQNFDQLGGLFGLDPFIVLGLATASSAGVGWLAGPFLGNAVFGVVYRRFRGQITEVSLGSWSIPENLPEPMGGLETIGVLIR